MQDLLEILENSAAPDEFLENTKLELYQDQVFCFTPKGQLIQLPRGATSVDFAYAVHSQIGDTCVGARINGRLMPLRYELQNGDQVEILTARGGTPSPAWERFVVTGKARARIRRFLTQQMREQHRDAGKSTLAKAFRQEGVDGSEKVLEPTAKLLKQASARRSLRRGRHRHCRAEGSGLRRLSGTARSTRAAHAAGLHGPVALTARSPRNAASKGETGMPVTGLVSGMDVHYAGCCHPLPGDKIVGIVATGKGVTVHTKDCATLDTFAATPERFIDVDWDTANSPEPAAKPQRYSSAASASSPATARARWPASPTPSPNRTAPSPISKSSTASRIFSKPSSMSKSATCAISARSSPACAAPPASRRWNEPRREGREARPGGAAPWTPAQRLAFAIR